MRHAIRPWAVVAAGATLLVACGGDQLTVNNQNNPDLSRIYSSPSGIEGVVGTLYQQYFSAVQGSSEGLNVQSKAFALESYGQVANFGLALRGAIPRIFINNQRGNQVATGNNTNWSSLSRLIRTSSVAVQSLDRLTAGGGTLGSPSQNARARAFGFFVNGVAIGTLALGYDSVAFATPATPTTEVPGLTTPQAATTAALAMLDSAIAISANATGAGGFPLPNTWINGIALSQADFVRLARSYKAKFRSGVARTPTERAAVDWNAVIADATNGITADLRITLSPAAGWSTGLDAGTFQTSASWHQVSLMISGMADTSGAYQQFMSLPLNARNGNTFLIQTPDQRWPQGATRAAQQASSTLPLTGRRYIHNRPAGEDQVDQANPWGTSNYDHRRWWAINQNQGNGPFTFISKTEIDMLAAEGFIRTNRFAEASALVNLTRVPNGLPAFNATSATDRAPGGTACVPQVVQAPSFNTVACGTLLEAMKYEKRMETQLTGYMQWFTDSRGWGDLPEATAVHWPVPFQEMDTRNKPFYNMPSTGTAPGAARSTYGF